ncbi:MAG TPA: RNA 3'-terminal phosphate cyclase [Nitrososphaeraceae archaeon]|nr:RNA 3'-terminal phosphate cyclase [Nitrososphaeraceae archaeon]
MLKIDGSFGEGGGQILRSTICLSVLLEKPVEIFNIRSKRPNPGLRPQHVHAVKALSTIFNATVENLCVGNQSIKFYPNRLHTDKGITELEIDIGTAGSISLILQTIVPAISLSKKNISIKIIGGTDVIASPTIDYMKYVVSEAYKNIGIIFKIDVIRRGYYPKGGGIVQTKILPCKNLGLIDFISGQRSEPIVIGVCSRLPRHVLDRQISTVLLHLEKNNIRCNNYIASVENAISPGSSILVYTKSDFGQFIGGDAVGQKNKSAEDVGKEAVTKFLENYIKNVPVDHNLADMLVIPASLARGNSRFVIGKVTEHLKTNLYIVSKMVGCKYSITPIQEKFLVSIEEKSDVNI